jgi:hypothetical protein
MTSERLSNRRASEQISFKCGEFQNREAARSIWHE